MEKLEDAVSGRKEIDVSVLEELEYALITADIGAKTTAEILERIRQRIDRHLVGDIAELKNLIREHLLEILQATERPVPLVTEPRGASSPKAAAFCCARRIRFVRRPSNSSKSGPSEPAPR
jgi:signal recognition particle GTPase